MTDPTPPTICFIDVETTGTDPGVHRPWEIGLIVRAPFYEDQEYCWLIDHQDLDFRTAVPKALDVGRFHARHPWANSLVTDPVFRECAVADALVGMTAGAVLVGANVGSFDVPFLKAMFARCGLTPEWDYHYVEVESYAAGAVGLEPTWKLDILLGVYGIEVPDGARHTALGDARLERDLYDTARAQARRRVGRILAAKGVFDGEDIEDFARRERAALLERVALAIEDADYETYDDSIRADVILNETRDRAASIVRQHATQGA